LIERSNSDLIPKFIFVITALLWVITQRIVVISYRCFGTT